MSTPILATKLYTPLPRPNAVLRPRLIERLNEGLLAGHKLTLVSAPAGFGKTTLVSEWVNQKAEGGRMGDEAREEAHPSSLIPHPSQVAWLSLDAGDNDPARFMAYLIAALQTIAPTVGAGALRALHASQPQPPPTEAILTALLNEITTLPDHFVLVLDDYHALDAKPIDLALAFLLERLPRQMHLVIATREDPHLPLARLRARGQLTELRAADLRFTVPEAAEFLNRVMGLTLSSADIAVLEDRTEGWIAGLQLAALSMQGHQDTTRFIQSFTGSHQFVMDYLVEEVLRRQPADVQTFLLRTSILDRLCGPLCDAVLGNDAGGRMKDDREWGSEPSSRIPHPSSLMLEYLQHTNLFIVSLDNERRWYRYHHLFADLLRQRLRQSATLPPGDERWDVAELHRRASQWYEDHGLDIEAFHHAVAAHDIERAERLIEGQGIPLHLRGAVTAILDWLASLPKTVLDARPSLWWRYGSLLLINGQTTGVAEKLDAAEAALLVQQPRGAQQSAEADDRTRNLLGRIAAARAVLALTRYDANTMLVESRRALEYLDPNNLSLRANALWTLGYAYLFQGDRTAARRALTEAISLSQAAGAIFTTILATIGLGNVQEGDNQLHLAAETYRRVLQLTGDQPLQIVHEAHLGLARVCYEWNDLRAAERHARQSLQLAQQYDRVIDRFVICEVFLARLKLAQGDVAVASSLLAQASLVARQKNFVFRLPEVVAAQVLTALRQGDLAAAAQLAQTHDLPISHARVYLAQNNPSAALAALEPVRRQAEARGWADEQLKVMVLQAVAHHARGDKDKAAHTLGEALALAEPGGFIRIFVDEGAPMAELLTRLKDEGGRMQAYIRQLLAAFTEQPEVQALGPSQNKPASFRPQPLLEPLSSRELEVLRLIAQGLSNSEISARLVLALDTVKGHNRKIFDKLRVQRRTEAVARARELGLL